MNLSMKQNPGHKKQTGGCQQGCMEWDTGISRPKFLYREWINKKVLLYSTENYIQYPMINHNEKENFKKNVDMCMSHVAVQQKLI